MLEKKIPKTLDDCYKLNGLIERLYKVSELIKTVGKVINIILGILFGISLIVVLAMDTYASAKITLLFTTLIAGAGTILSVFIIAFLLSLAFESLASIVLHTRISANVALYTAKRTEESENAQNTTVN